MNRLLGILEHGQFRQCNGGDRSGGVGNDHRSGKIQPLVVRHPGAEVDDRSGPVGQQKGDKLPRKNFRITRSLPWRDFCRIECFRICLDLQDSNTTYLPPRVL